MVGLLVVGNFHLPSGKALFGAQVMMTIPKSVMSYNVLEVNESQFSIFHLLNYNFNCYKQYEDDKEQGICVVKDFL